MFLLLSLIAVRLVWVQGLGPAYAGAAVEQRTRTVALPATRGRVLDRNGAVLAHSVEARAVFGEPRVIAKGECDRPGRPCRPAEIAAALAPVLGLPAGELEERLARPTGFVYLARGLDRDVAARVAALRLPGVGVLKEPRRVYPGQDVAANVLGFTRLGDKGELRGAAGVELAADRTLFAENGRSSTQVDSEGRTMPGGKTITEPVPGEDVRLTLDRDVQWYAQKALAEQIAATDAESGSAVVMDVKTGEVLALASVPTLNANKAGAADPELRGNKALSDVFEPGSVGKVVTAAAALEKGVVTPDTVLSVPDRIRMANKNFKDSHDHPVERMTVTGVLVESSNVGTIMMAQRTGQEAVRDALVRFGLGAKSGLGLPGESRGVVPKIEDWSGTTFGALAIGQSYSVNGLQMASVYATVANDGVRVPPSIFKGRPVGGGKRVIPSAVAAQLRGMLEGVVTEAGTAPDAAVPGYRVAGKTGTAQRVVDGRYSGYTASFVGFAPADAPRLAISVSVQDPKKAYYGGAVAAPVFREIMQFALRSTGTPPTGAVAPALRLRE